MGGRSDNLHPALVGLCIGFAANERRQERMVDIDNPVPVMLNERRRNNLHVAGQDDDVDILSDDLKLTFLRFGFGLRCNRDVMERYAE
ncbi:hypothetical protein D3C73_1144430 [compost metagenome]